MNINKERKQKSAIYTIIARILLVTVVLLSGLLLACCPVPEPEATQAEQDQAEYSGKRIVWVDSYHEGYEWSDGIGIYSS